MNAAQSCVAAVWKRLQSSDRPAAPGDFHHLASTCGADLWVLANVLRQTSKASAMKRSFFVKLNLDEVGHAIIEYDDMASLGQWFKGYLLGAHGRPAKADAPDPYQAGHAYGLAAFHDAEAFRAKQAANGALGGRPPKPEETQTLPKAKPDESQTITQTKPIEHRASSIEKREEITEHPRAGADPGDIFAGPGRHPHRPQLTLALRPRLALGFGSGHRPMQDRSRELAGLGCAGQGQHPGRGPDRGQAGQAPGAMARPHRGDDRQAGKPGIHRHRSEPQNHKDRQ